MGRRPALGVVRAAWHEGVHAQARRSHMRGWSGKSADTALTTSMPLALACSVLAGKKSLRLVLASACSRFRVPLCLIELS